MISEKNRSQFEFSEIFAVILRRKWLIILPMILVSVATYAGSFLITPKYETSIIIWVGNPVRLSDGLQRLVGDDIAIIGRSRNRNDELRSLQNEITSTPYIHQLIQILKLNEDAGLNKKAMAMKSEWPYITVEQIKFNLLLEDLRERISIEFSGRDQVRITTKSVDPYKARDMAEKLGEIFIAEKMKQQMSAIRISQDFSYEQLEKYEKDLQDKINASTAFEKEYVKIQLDELITSDDNRKDITSEIEATKIEITDKEEETRKLRVDLAKSIPEKLVLKESKELIKVKKDIKKLLTSITNLMLKYRWNAPEILNFKSRLYFYIDEMEDENNRLVEIQFAQHDKSVCSDITMFFNIRAQLDMLYSKRNNLDLALTDLNNKIGLIPEYQARLDQFNREVTAAGEIRDRFKQQQESAQISQAILRESEYQVVQPAELPLSPVWPDKKKLMIMGIILGLVVGGGITFLVELMDSSFRKVEDVENFLGCPVVGVIPEIEAVKKVRLSK